MSSPNLRIAHAYDRNRFHPPEVSGRVATAIIEPLDRHWREPHLLEIGVGTGRIAMPLVARGYRLTGLDTDADMMELFRSKYSGVSRKVSLIEADAQELPFDRHSFHAVIAVHIWHLIPDLEVALSEAVRVLKPGGVIFEGWDAPAETNAEVDIQNRWIEAAQALGHSVPRGSQRAALATSRKFFKVRRYQSAETQVATWTLERSPAEVLESLEEGLFSFTSSVPLDVRYRAAKAVRQQLLSQYDSLDAPIRSEWSFHLRSTQVAGQPNAND